MLTRTNSLRLGLLIGANVLAVLSTRADERTQILLRGKQGNLTSLATLMKTQPAGAHLQLAVDTPPAVARLLPLLPHGTRHKRNLIQLPNGSDFEVVKAKTVAQRRAAFETHTETREELIVRLQHLKSYGADATVKVRRPHQKTFTAIGKVDRAILEVPYLPTGTYTIAVAPVTKATYQFYRIAGEPKFPEAHAGKSPGLRWTQQATRGRWEEEPVKSETGLHWVQRADGYWEEAPVKQ